jgi:hypothetical protein
METMSMPKKLTQVTSEVVFITQDIAAEMLATSLGNRPINLRRAEQYAQVMGSGGWVINGEAIIFDNNGRLLDGHHRLTASAKHGVSFRSVVIRNVSDPNAFMTIDQGAKKTGGDIFALAGIPSYRAQASTQMRYAEDMNSIGKMSVSHTNIPFAPTTAWLLEQYKTDPEGFDHSVRMGDLAYRKLPFCNIPMMAACHYMFSLKNREMADIFFEKVASGENLTHGDPAYMLRDAWIRRSDAKHKENARNMMVKAVYAWNAYRNHRKIAALRHNSAAPVPAFI